LNVCIVSEDVITNLASPWRVLLLLNCRKHFIGNNNNYLFVLYDVEVACHKTEHARLPEAGG
jgi:hypothetical protein